MHHRAGTAQSGPRHSQSFCTLAVAVVPVALARRSRQRGRRHIDRQVWCCARPYPAGVYDLDTSGAYCEGRPLQVFGRAIQLASAGVGFGAGLLLDRQLDRLDENAEDRAKELVTKLSELGPTFIKIGQALSSRADLLPEAYLKALTELQDRCPPFSNDVADKIIREELGRPVDDVFEELSVEPIASASLGQVYRGKLQEGPEVAVKVQRPGMEDLIATDLYLLRAGAVPVKEFLKLFTAVDTDLVGLIDAWGSSFVGELDYMREADNARSFEAAIKKTPLAHVVCSPPVVDSCTSSKVLTTAWIDGERLEKCTSDDVTTLCSVAMNTYLTMLLQLDVLHADPHPGNLLRMSDGRLCILDWGLVTSLDKDLQFSYIEHIAHLVSGEYSEVPGDLVKLGFVPEGKEVQIENTDVVQVLADVYSQWTSGGGAARMDVAKFLNELQDLARRYGGIFRMPPYFFTIMRAFLTLDGIGLSNDPNYSVVQECLPYISQRLLTDPSPRAATALETYVYGEDRNSPDRQLSAKKVEYLADGYTAYTSSAGSVSESTAPDKAAEVFVDQFASLLVGGGDSNDNDPTPLQEIVLDELAKVVGAGARQTFSMLGLFGLAEDGPSVVTPDASDKKALEAAQRLAQIADPQVRRLVENFRELPSREQGQVARAVLSKLWDYRTDAARAGGRLLRKLVAQGLLRASRDLAPRPPTPPKRRGPAAPEAA